MFVDQASLFIAAGICAAALAMTMLSVWVNNRADMFLVSWTAGMLLLAAGVLMYSVLPQDNLPIVALAFGLESLGFVAIYVASRQFTGLKTSRNQYFGLLLTVPVVMVPILAGYDGIGLLIYNGLAGVLLAATGLRYWAARSEAPSCITALTIVYSLAAMSFFACGTILLHEGRWSLGTAPDNWAEQFNAIMSIAGITGIGALSLGLNNARAARRHQVEARTDSLTGLLNRRALFDAMSLEPLRPGHAVVAFDLDRFKLINDQHGHAAGDAVLKSFADALRLNLRQGDLVARTGGEEFILVMANSSLQLATSTAERIRAMFAASPVATPAGPLSATASAGVAFVQGQEEPFEDALHRADHSLYRAKDGGRNRVVTELQAVA